jgi:hypothetical protein
VFNFFKKEESSTDPQIIDLINKLPLHPELKVSVEKAANRYISDDYSGDELDQREQKARDLEIIRDATEISAMDIVEKSKKSFTPLIPGASPAGYQPAGSILRKIYPREYALQCFLAEAYWAAAKARKELWVEMHRDDYTLVAAKGVPNRTIKMINNALEDLKVSYYRNKLRDTALVCGNVLLANKKNRFGGLLELNPLLMERVDPHYNLKGELDGWIYLDGNRPVFIPYESVDHIATYSARSNVLGQPAMSSAIVDIEAALQAAIYNNNVMAKGGLLSVVFRLRKPENGQWNDRSSMNLAETFTKWLERRFGGIRNSGQMAFIPMVEGVDVLNKIGEMDAAWTNLDDKTAIKTAGLLGVFPERIGVVRKSQYENKQAVDDYMSLSFDNNNYYVTDLVDEYLTRTIIKEGMGIDNVKIQASGEFSSVTKTAAEVGKLISEMGADVMTVNQFRTDIMHISPLDGELGERFLGEVTREAALAKAKNSGSNLTKAIGPVSKPALLQFAEIPYIIHKRKNIAFY